MRRRKEFAMTKTDLHARIHVMLETEKGKVVHFCINLVLLEDDKSYDIYRVDTFHGFLHEQKFWRKPEKIKLNMDVHYAFNAKLKEVEENCEKWIKLFKEAKKHERKD